jgi:uncharacterized membrane protein
MSWLYLHLTTNHFPIILTVLGTVAGFVGTIRRDRNIWIYGVVTLALGSALAIPTWITGYQAHYVVEVRLGLPEGVVEPHEVLAEGTMWLMIPLAALSAFAWWRLNQEAQRGPSPGWVRPAVLITAVLGCVLLAITAFQGAKIAHSREGRAPSARDSAAAAQQSFQPIPPDSLRPGTGARTPQ